jgi:hypothetical protein
MMASVFLIPASCSVVHGALAKIAGMSDEHTPVTRPTGSYGIMTGACRETIIELAKWYISCPPAVDNLLLELMRELKACLGRVQRWTLDTPQDKKSEDINRILGLRAQADALAAKYQQKLR